MLRDDRFFLVDYVYVNYSIEVNLDKDIFIIQMFKYVIYFKIIMVKLLNKVNFVYIQLDLDSY